MSDSILDEDSSNILPGHVISAMDMIGVKEVRRVCF